MPNKPVEGRFQPGAASSFGVARRKFAEQMSLISQLLLHHSSPIEQYKLVIQPLPKSEDVGHDGAVWCGGVCYSQ